MTHKELHDKALRQQVIEHFHQLAELFTGTSREEPYRLIASQLECQKPLHMFTEEMRALLDAELTGIGYTVDGIYVDPKRVRRYTQQEPMVLYYNNPSS